jgi:hypothetical protein
MCEFKVDGKLLGHRRAISGPSHSASFDGIFSRKNGVDSMKALKFVKASFTSEDLGSGSTMAGMGKVELVVSEAILQGTKRLSNHEGAFVKTSSIKIDHEAPITKKKNLRSGEGNSVERSTYKYDMNASYKNHVKGNHLYTITLHYCAAPGLIAVGVLPAWDHLRRVKPSKVTAKKKAKLEKAVISVKRNRNGNEILELADTDDSDSDDDEDEDENEDGSAVNTNHAQSKLKKPKIELSNGTFSC